jgi:hypothetical protein
VRFASQLNQISNYQQPVDNLGENMISRSRHADNLWKLDSAGTLYRQSLSKAHREPLKRLARGVLLAIGIALCSASPAGQATTSQQITPFRYATFQIGELQAECLFRIAIRESNINYKAINKTSGALGAWQIVNPLVAKLDALDQVDWAIRYAEHRYGSACAAWSFWQKEYWW